MIYREIIAIQTNQLLLYREIIAVCSQIHTKHVNTLYGQNVELLSVKPVYYHWDCQSMLTF